MIQTEFDGEEPSIDQLTLSAVKVLSLIWNEGPISRTSLADRTGLAPSSVTRLTRILEQHKLIAAVETGESTGGRPPILLSFNEDAGVILAVDLSTILLRGAIFNAVGTTLHTIERPFTGLGHAAIETQVVDLILELAAAADRMQRRPLAIAVSIPGAVDTASGVVVGVNNLNLEDFAIGPILQKYFQLPVVLEHDTIAAAYAEHHFGAGRNSRNMIYVTVSKGIGAGIVLNNQVYRGEKGIAGEIGHIAILRDGPPCACGRHGCLEAVASATAVIQRAKLLAATFAGEGNQSSMLLAADTSDGLTVEAIIDAANDGDLVALQVLAETADYLAQALGAVSCVLDIGTVIIGGEIAAARENFLAPLRVSLPRYQFLLNPAVVLPAEMLQDASIKGVSLLALQQVFGLSRAAYD
jgi:predicted NBD/HSP70 family sugar kinase